MSSSAHRPATVAPAAHRSATVLLTALAPAAWGTTYVVTTELLPPGHPLFAGLMRSLPAGLAGLALTRVLPRGDWWWIRSPVFMVTPRLFAAHRRLDGLQHTPGGYRVKPGHTLPLDTGRGYPWRGSPSVCDERIRG